MAYADANTTRPNATSLLVSAGINVALIGAIFFAAPDVSGLTPSIITEIFPVTPDAPIDKREKPREKPDIKADPRPFVPPNADDALPPLGGGIIAPPGGADTALPPGPMVDERPFVPPQPIPLLVKARLDPRYAGALQPEYPPGMIREEREGIVTVRVLVGTDGRVREVVIVSAASPQFAAATHKHALRKWRFIPATRDGSPIESWRDMTVRFEIP